MQIIFYITPHENTRTGARVFKLHELEYDGSKEQIIHVDIKIQANTLIVINQTN